MQTTINTDVKNRIVSMPVSELLPHSEPMILITRIADFHQQSLRAEVDISPDSRFFDAEHQGVESFFAIEYMAQAIAALAGVRSHLNNEAVKLGFLLGTRKMQLHSPFLKAGQTYQVTVEELFMDDSGLGAFQCSVTCKDDIIAEAKLSVFETNDENQLLTN